MDSLKEKLLEKLGSFGMILYWALRFFIPVFPFFMIDLHFFLTFLLICIHGFFPLSSIVFWIWGLVCALKGVQDIWAILYYIAFVVLWVPLFISLLIEIVPALIISIKEKIKKQHINNEKEYRTPTFTEIQEETERLKQEIERFNDLLDSLKEDKSSSTSPLDTHKKPQNNSNTHINRNKDDDFLKKDEESSKHKYNQIRIIALIISLIILTISWPLLCDAFTTSKTIMEEYTEQKDIKTYVCYVTATGDCYHNRTCQYLQYSFYQTTVYEAVQDGYLKCSKCRPIKPTTITISETKTRPVTENKTNDFAALSISLILAIVSYNIIVFVPRKKYRESQN